RAREKGAVVNKPLGCVDDLDPAKGEHRRVTFYDFGRTSNGRPTDWSIKTEIVHPPPDATSDMPAMEPKFIADPDKTLGIPKPGGYFNPIPFEEYDLGGGRIDWINKRHVCIFVDPDDPDHKGSHKQLWVLYNNTSALHNFHIHQMKFRLATATELKEHRINIDREPPSTCPVSPAPCSEPNYKLYEEGAPDQQTRWHDTLPIPPGRRAYVIMSFDALQQIGRFVFHCHILKHEDNGLMAPIEVWAPTPGAVRQ